MAAADFEDSNIALLGSDLEKEVRKTAAETVAAYKGAGESEGTVHLQLYRESCLYHALVSTR